MVDKRVNDEVTTLGELREVAQSDVDQRLSGLGDNTFGRVVATVMRDGMTDERVRELASREGVRLGGGVHLRDIPAIPEMDYMGVPHHALKDAVTRDSDPGAVGRLADEWAVMGDHLADLHERLRAAADAVWGEWRGVAAEKARAFITELTAYIGDMGAGASLAGRQLRICADALAEARKMPDPVPFDSVAAVAELKGITDPVARANRYAEHAVAYAASKAAHQQAAHIASVFDRTLADVRALPAFTAPPTIEHFAVPPPAGRVERVVPRGGREGVPGPGRVVAPAVDPGHTDEAAAEEHAHRPPRPGTTEPVSPAVDAGAGPVAEPIGGSGGSTASRTEHRGEGVTTGANSTGGAHGGARRQGFGDMPRQSDVVGGRGAGGSSPSPGPRERFGVTPPARPLPDQRATGGGTSREGRSHVVAPGASGKREDEERERPSYLVEADPDGLFGTDEYTSPPVIE